MENNIILEKPKWTKDEFGNIHFDVISDGTTGEGWINIFQKEGVEINVYAREDILKSKEFKPTSEICYEVVILKPENYFSRNEKFNYVDIRSIIFEQEGFSVSHAEIACLILKKFSKEELKAMEIESIIIMSSLFRAYNDFIGYSNFLPAVFNHTLECCPAEFWYNFKLEQKQGFAFVEKSYPAYK